MKDSEAPVDILALLHAVKKSAGPCRESGVIRVVADGD